MGTQIVPEEPSEQKVGVGGVLPVSTRLGQKRRIERGPSQFGFDPEAGVLGLVTKGSDIAAGRKPVSSLTPEEALGMAAMGAGSVVRGAPGAAAVRTAQPEVEALVPRGGPKRAAEGLRTETLGRVKGEAERETGAAQRAEAEARSWLEIEQNRQRVLSDLREKARVLEKSHREAGANTVEAQNQVHLAERRLRDVDAGVQQLEQHLLTRPKMSAEDFGRQIRQTTQEIHDKYSAIRKSESGFDQALDSAGDQPRVDTTRTEAIIDQHLKSIRNPTLERVLNGMKDLLQSDIPHPRIPGETVKIPRLSVRAAESARGYLDSVIRSKQFGDLKIDKETLFIIRQVKKSLVESATTAWQPYRQALAKWRTLSRPLDIVERKGALRKVIDTDPVSTDYALSEAQVVGRVLSEAKAGNPALTRLIQENPAIKDAARLHFTQDLFIREQVPSEAMLRTWLKNNERALKQTGLYNEFRDIRVARETANRAVAQAKGGIEQSKAQLKSAQQAEKGASEQLATAERLRQKQLGRIADAQKAAKNKAAEAEGVTVLSSKRIPAERSAAEKRSEAGKRRAAADEFRRFETEVGTARTEEIPAKARSVAQRLAKDGRISNEEYEATLKKIQTIEDRFKSRDKRIIAVKRLLRGTIYAGLGYGAYREFREFTGF